MPDIADYNDKKSWMKACVPKLVEEGKEQKQAVAICLNMWGRKDEEDYDSFMAACVPVLMRYGHTEQEAMKICDEIYLLYAEYEEEYHYDWNLDGTR